MAWAPPEVEVESSTTESWSPPEARGWQPPEVEEPPALTSDTFKPERQWLPGSFQDPGTGKEFLTAVAEPIDQALTKAGNVARGIVADVGVGISSLKKPENFEVGLFPQPKKTLEAISKNVNESSQYSGNIISAVKGEPLPIDAAIGESALADAEAGKFPLTATVAHISQGLAATAPLIAGIATLPAWASRLVSLGFSADMIYHAPELFEQYAEEINKPKEQQNPDKIASLTSGILQTAVFAPLAGAHGVRPKARPVEVVALEQAKAPMTAKVVEDIHGGALKDLTPEQQAKSNAVKDAMASEFEALKGNQKELDNAKEAKGGVIKPERGLPESATENDLISDMTQTGRDYLISVQKTKDEYTGLDATNLSPADRRNLARVGVSFTTDRQNNVVGTWPARKRSEALREKVSNKPTPTAPVEKVLELKTSTEPKATAKVETVEAKKPRPEQPDIAESSLPPVESGGEQKYQLTDKAGKKIINPQPHTLIERLPATALEKKLGESSVRVRNDKTGVEFITQENQLKVADFSEKPAKPKPAKGLDAKLTDAGLDPSVFPNAKSKREALKRDKAIRNPKPEVQDWTSATAELIPDIPGGKPTELHAGIPMPKFSNRKMSPLDKVTTTHSAKIQKSFDEARRAQKEIRREVPSDKRQAAISIWREAAGDIPTLQAWEATAKGKAFKQASKDAQSLTPKEIAIANKAIDAFDVLENRGNTFDVLGSHRDNYVPHVWDVKRPGSGFGGGMLKQRFRFSKARTFNTFFEGDQAGFKPKALAIGKLLPAYIHEMNRVIADRQMVKDIAAGTMPDGSPMSSPRGNVTSVDNTSGKAVLVQPKSSREADTSDYRVMSDQPALSNWTWEGKDTQGNPVFVKADLALHPDVFRRVNASIGQSAIRNWYNDPVSGTAQIPRAIVRGIDKAQSAMKREMFGLLAPFHQVQEGTHAVGHLVNPFFNVPKVDLRNQAQLDAANHGLMLLPDRASSRSYLEGVGTDASILSRIIRKGGKPGRVISDVIDGYQDYLFHQYIPGLKFKTYEAMLGRNTKLYESELKSGAMTEADVKITSAEQANAAYGHLNYALLDRNPTIQHTIQLSMLAPDFLEARARFTGQGIKGLTSKVGHEQFKAIAILAAVQAGTAFILSNLMGDKYDPEHPFEVIHNGRRYAMRSVPEDIFGILKDTRQFIYARVNPLTVKGGVQLATGLNYRGEKTTSLETMEELLAGYIPITARSLPGVRELTKTSRNSPVTPLQQLAGSLGLRISRYSPISETYKMAGEWMDKQGVDRNKGSYPVSKYQQLRYALEDGDMERAGKEYAELKQTMDDEQIERGFESSITHPFTDSQESDEKFSETLKGHDKELYDQAVRLRENILNSFYKIPTEENK